jgi:uracil phosphoribosyltransferase|nr:uracil phosphoribosyltransferase [Bacteroidales bacterium]MDI9591628.1 uracil phosphoribosyltransferase [Bacteroidota bacterium]NLH33761.1 uracil phosphoribosyltransferase [Lentimicrobium sp.]OQC38566.1 MAG: Uracil phosphoribosyltransferase [Bacteroidetes bacterium ADurb.Bin041]MBP7874889.1 uracil phosphoribosyltransferase [Bacteroidales bacterium]
MVNNLGKGNSLLNQYISELRDVEIQKDTMRFRKNLSRIGSIFAYEISKKLEYKSREIITPLGTSEMKVLKNYPVVASIIRAGLPVHQGFLDFFDRSENAFISSYRKYYKDGNFDVHVQYVSKPSVQDKDLILVDSMLATGVSMALTYRELISDEKPRHSHLIAVVASVEGVNYIKRNLSSKNVTIWVGAIDDELTAEAYIVPGLGDAGDLAFGVKP